MSFVFDPRKDSSAWLLSVITAALCTLAVGWIEARPRDPFEVAVIFAPWTGAEIAIARVARAGGVIERQGVLASILVVHGDDAGFAARLYRQGALAVVDPVAFGGCLSRRAVSADAEL